MAREDLQEVVGDSRIPTYDELASLQRLSQRNLAAVAYPTMDSEAFHQLRCRAIPRPTPTQA